MGIQGRQILSSEDIEVKSTQLLLHFDPYALNYVKATPLTDLVSFLEKKHQIIFRFDDHLGFSDKGERILGAFNPKKKVIIVDASLKADLYKFNFTLAHELGHLALHRNVKLVFDDKNVEEPSETINEQIGSKNTLKTEADWMEWQANYYASALLMPREPFKAALILHQKELGISRTGKIFLDDQRSNQSDFRQLVAMLSEFFKVSQTAVEIRLKKLTLIEDHRRGRSLRDIMDDLRL